jgi:signal transduction histidine kinase/ligand-binding sensor domain-containing protein/DNA-binding response OmpR family regulator
MKSLLTILLLIFSVVGLYAQEQFKFRQLTIDDGLSHNQVNAIYKDKLGFIWIGTHAGLNRFDGNRVRSFFSDSRDTTTLTSSSISGIFPLPDGKLILATAGGLNVYDREQERFYRNAAPLLQKFKVPGVGLTDIVEDANGNFWFVYEHTVALYRSKDQRTFLIAHDPADTMSLSSAALTGFTSDKHGNFWIAHADGVFEKIHAGDDGLRVSYRDRHFVRSGDSRFYAYRIYADSDGDLWFLVINDNQGVYHFNYQKKQWNHYTSQSEGIRLNTSIVSMLVEDNNGLIWVGTDHGGINLIDKRKKTVRYIKHLDEDATSLAQNSVNYLYKDDLGILWLGTYKRGISFHNENIFRFPVYQHHAFDPASLPFDDVNRFVEDEKGNVWIGTNGGGLIYFDRSKGTFKQYLNRPGDSQSLSSNVIVSLAIDHEKKLWVGTYYGGLNVFDGHKFTRFTHDPNDSLSISGKNIWEIFEDSRLNLWIGTIEGGVNRFDRRTGAFERLPLGQQNGIRSPYISEIMEDKEGNIWFGTGLGIDVYDPLKKTFQHYEYSATDQASLSNNNVLDIHQDVSGRIWVGTFEGLNLFNPIQKSFRVYRDRDGLSHNTILTIQEDSRGHIWLGTPNGLSEMLPDANGGPTFMHYTPADGLQGLQFNENAAYKTRSGELFFGGPMGFNLFTPEQLKVSKNRQRIILTDFQLFQKSLRIGESIKGRVILSKAITETKQVVLPPGQNYFSIEYSTLNYFHSEKSEVQYMLEGLGPEWLPVDNDSRKLTFTGLNSGEYSLKFRIANEDGTWAEQKDSLAISVLPPFWKTNFAFFLYMVALAGILYFARKLIEKREQMKYAIEHERQEAIRMHELDIMKIKFFTNVSHEFRTPLTLILTPLEKMIQLTSDQERTKQYAMIQRNAKRLLNLVNQLLDFRKLEVQEVRFNPSEGDIISFIRETVFSFSDLSEKNDIRLEYATTVKTLETLFDPDKLEKILFNLLSNAFKFTPEHGVVSVQVDTNKRDDGLWLMISVADSGIGIPADKLDRVFDRFFQTELPKTIVNQGSGIGLSITREFVRIHGGEIKVRSELGKGTEFNVSIPVREVLVHDESVVALPQKARSADVITTPEEPAVDDNGHFAEQNPGTKTLLLVEDNDDFRFYLKDNLKQFYSIAEARNGDEGWRQTLAVQPDLVVSDVMMPGINGMELCRKIKNDERVSHIPVILLTARSAEEQKLEGIQMGADDYITKPFNFEILESRIRNLIEQREKSQKVFRKTLDVKASELDITPLDQKFIQNAIRCVEKNVSSPDFSVEHLGRELGISRAYLYKKIVALTGKSPLEFMRTIRLQHAAQLLEKSQLTVAEVAYQVGFNNPKYFTKYFKEEFNVLPSHYAGSKKKATS